MSLMCFEPDSSSSGRRMYIYSYDTVRFTCISKSSLVGGRMLMLTHVKRTYCNCIYSYLPEDEPSGSKHLQDVKKLEIKILI
jgi:hypothetical protein